MKAFLRRALLLFAFALVLAQIAFCCLFSGTAFAQGKTSSYLGINVSADSQEEENYSAFYPEEISVFHRGIFKGNILVQENLGGTLIPVGALSVLMEWSIAVDQNNQVADGYDRNTDQKISFIPAIHTIMIDDKIKELVENEMIFDKNDVYVDLDVLNKMGIQLTLERSRGILTVGTLLSAEDILITPPTVHPLIPPVQGFPEFVEESPIDDKEDHEQDFSLNSEKENPEAQVSVPEKFIEAPKAIPPPSVEDEMREESAEEVVVVPEKDMQTAYAHPQISEDEEVLVLQLIINDVTMTDLLDAKMQFGKVFLPFCTLSEILEFPIECNVGARTAEGWFLRQKNTLSMKIPSVNVKGQYYDLKPEQYISNDEDIYIDQDILQSWFSLKLAVNTKAMELSITSENPFPFEERMKREQLYAILENKKKMAEAQKKFTPYEFPYKGLSTPVTDVNFDSSYNTATEHRTVNLYNIQGSGDFAYMHTKYYLSGDFSRKPLMDARFSMGREDYKKELLGPLNASAFRFGDINSIGVSQIAQASEGRGIMLTNRDISRPDKFDVTSFSGDSTPGWDVELYRNGTLIDTTTVGIDGRYEFNDVPILFGNNVFRTLLLGPQGQIEEQIKNINTDSSLIDKGAFTYNLSVDQKSQRLYEKRDIEPDHPLGTRLAGEVEYGISRWLTASLGSSRTYIKDGEHKYVSAGTTASFLGILTSLNHAEMMGESGRSTKMVVFANYFGTNMRASQKVADDFVSEEETAVDNPVKLESTVDLDRVFAIPYLGELSTGLYLQNTTYENDMEEKVARLRMSKNFMGFNVSNTVEQSKISNAEKRIIGDFSLRGSLYRNLLSLTADYDLQPSQNINHYVLGWRRNLSSNITNNFTFTHRYDSGAKNEIENALTWDLKDYKLYLTGRYDSDENVFAGIGLNFSFGKYHDHNWEFSSRNQAETGIVVAKTYVDKNYNLQKDDGEEPAENISLKIGSRFYTTDKEGTAVATNLETNSPVYMYADDRKLADKQLGKSLDGYELDLRPGTPAEVHFPIFMTAEIEGLVEFPDNVIVPKDMKILLMDENSTTVSESNVEYDGYFLFRNVLPGTYNLRLPEDVMAEQSLVYFFNPDVVVGKEDDFVSAELKLSVGGNSNK